MATDIDQFLIRYHVAAETIVGQRIGHFWANHAGCFRFLPTGSDFRAAFLAFLLAAELGMDLGPILASSMTGLTRNASDYIVWRLNGEMTVQTRTIRR